MVKIAPSILSADFARLGQEVVALEAAGADWIHIDVMDGRFVPNLTFGPPVVKALRPQTELIFDCHLMIVEPERYVAAFAEAGADYITVHAEACTHLHRVLGQIRELGVKAGVALNPATPVQSIAHVLELTDLVLLMSVNPGFGGQQFLPLVYRKFEELQGLFAAAGVTPLVQVDGGVTPANSGSLQAAGADVLVAGSAIFSAPDRAAAILALRG